MCPCKGLAYKIIDFVPYAISYVFTLITTNSLINNIPGKWLRVKVAYCCGDIVFKEVWDNSGVCFVANEGRLVMVLTSIGPTCVMPSESHLMVCCVVNHYLTLWEVKFGGCLSYGIHLTGISRCRQVVLFVGHIGVLLVCLKVRNI